MGKTHFRGDSRLQQLARDYNFTFEALITPDAVPGSDATHIGTEADLVAEIQDYYLEHDYALLDRETEERQFADHELSLRSARRRQNILDPSFPTLPPIRCPLHSPCASARSV